MRPPLPKRVRHSELRPRSLLIHTPVILSTRPAPSREAKAGRSDSRAHCRNEARRTLLPFGRAHRSRLGAVARARWRSEFPRPLEVALCRRFPANHAAELSQFLVQ